MKRNAIQIASAALIALCAYCNAYAADIAREMQSSNGDNGSFAEVGVLFLGARVPLVGFIDAKVHDDDPNKVLYSLDLGLQGRLAYKGVFAEVIQESFNNITFGYSITNTENFSLDFIATQSFDGVERSQAKGFETITDRKGDVNLGFRSIVYNGRNVFQFGLTSDVNDAHGGFMFSAQYGRQFQVRNWNLHSLIGTRYFSEKMIDFYFDVSEAEATDTLPSYSSSEGGFLPTLQLGATLPLNEHWVLRATGEYSYLPGTVRKSPLSQGDDLVAASVGFYRVFYPKSAR